VGAEWDARPRGGAGAVSHVRVGRFARTRTRTRTRARTHAFIRTHAGAQARTRTHARNHRHARTHEHKRTQARAGTHPHIPARTRPQTHPHPSARAHALPPAHAGSIAQSPPLLHPPQPLPTPLLSPLGSPSLARDRALPGALALSPPVGKPLRGAGWGAVPTQKRESGWITLGQATRDQSASAGAAWLLGGSVTAGRSRL
jgi:hypothetical protein